MLSFCINVIWNTDGLPCALALDLGPEAEFADWANLAQECMETWLPSLRAPVFAKFSAKAWHQMCAAVADGSITAADSEIFSPFYFVSPPEVWTFPACEASFSMLANLGFKTIIGQLRLDKSALSLLTKAGGAEISCKHLAGDICKSLAQKITNSGRVCLVGDIPSKPLAKELANETEAIFSGPALSAPDLPSGAKHKPEAASAKALRLLQMANAQVDLAVIEEEIRQDATCSYKLITMINSAGLRTQKAVSSVREAIVFLGYAKLSQWLSMLLLSSATKPYGSPALRFSLAVRAKIAESVALIAAGPRVADTAFCAAMFSGLDGLFDKPLDELMKAAGVAGPLKAAATDHAGPAGNAVLIAKLFETDPVKAQAMIEKTAGNAIDVHKILHQAISWSIGFQSFAKF